MPLVQIKSLPLSDATRVPDVLRQVSARVARDTGIDEEHVSVTWEYYRPGHYAYQGQVAERHGEAAHPIVVEVSAPDFNDRDSIAAMLRAVAAGLADAGIVPEARVFAIYRPVQSGNVLDEGQVEWE